MNNLKLAKIIGLLKPPKGIRPKYYKGSPHEGVAVFVNQEDVYFNDGTVFFSCKKFLEG